MKRRQLGILALILTGFLLSFMMWQMASPSSDLLTGALSAGFFYALFILCYLVAGPVAVWCYRLHSWVRETVFLGSVEVPDFSWWAIGLTILTLNLTFFTYESLLPFRALLIAVFPLFETVSAYIPVSMNDALSSPYLVLPVLLELNFPGPAIVFVVRRLRRKNHRFGRSLFGILQLLAYASVLLIVLSWEYGAPSNMPFALYQNLVLIFLLPTNIGGVGIILLLATAKSRQRRPYY